MGIIGIKSEKEVLSAYRITTIERLISDLHLLLCMLKKKKAHHIKIL